MKRLLFAALFAIIPLMGFADQQPSHNGAPDNTVRLLGISADQTLAIGLGVVGGAIGLHILLGGGSATLAGALAGALIGNWWFEQKVKDSRSEIGLTVNYSPVTR